MGLVGRGAERAAVEAAVEAARAGLSAALVLRGPPGIGKTALLEHAAQSAPDLRVLRLVGIESEHELGFAGLHQLLVPLLAGLDELPGPQRSALRSAFGLAEDPAADGLRVGLAALSLLASAARARPLLCLVDDVHWLDDESARSLGVVARRLFADRVAMLFAVRDDADEGNALDGVERLDLVGLSDTDAASMLRAAVAGGIDEQVIQHVVASTGGNPLALIELGGDLTPDQRNGTAVLPEPLPVGRELEASFLRQVQQYPPEARRYLLLVAAETSGDPVLVDRAADILGLGNHAASAAEDSGLVTFGTAIRFRHPVIRSAVYHGALVSDRRAAHDALASASLRDEDLHRRAWHRAAASEGPDEEIAAELEATAERARRRGGASTAAAFLIRAAEMTPDPGDRAIRWLGAAEADLTAGAPARALRKIEQAVPELTSEGDRIRALRLEGASRFALGETADALPILIDAAHALGPIDPRLARDTLLDALSVGVFTGRQSSRGSFAEVERATTTIVVPPGEITPGDLLLDALAALYVSGHSAAAVRLRAALASLDREHDPADEMRWLGFGCLAAGSLGDYDRVLVLATRLVALARRHDALVVLTRGLYFLALAQVVLGDLDAAGDTFTEGRELRAARGDPAGLGGVIVLAWRGDEVAARAEAAEVVQHSTERNQAGVLVYAEYGLAVLELSAGNYAAALEHARRVEAEDSYFLATIAVPDLVEAAVRAGDRKDAAVAYARLAARAAVNGTSFALGMLARSRALLDDGPGAEDAYREAIDRLTESGARGHEARAHLLYGEWLRRRKRRSEGREHLRSAVSLFEKIGAERFAERARIELLATGEHARKRSVEARSDLTPQEAQIARLAAGGSTNPEIAGQLFLSTSTVDYHLRKVFRKLDISSRRQLRTTPIADTGAPA